MEIQDVEHLQARLRYWKNILSHQHSIKKAQRSDRTIAEAKNCIARLQGWLEGKEEQESEAPIEKPFTKEEFREYMKAIGLDTSKPDAVLTVDTRKQIDQMWPWLKTANVQLRIPHHLTEYFHQKMDQETNRPYKAITK